MRAAGVRRLASGMEVDRISTAKLRMLSRVSPNLSYTPVNKYSQTTRYSAPEECCCCCCCCRMCFCNTRCTTSKPACEIFTLLSPRDTTTPSTMPARSPSYYARNVSLCDVMQQNNITSIGCTSPRRYSCSSSRALNRLFVSEIVSARQVDMRHFTLPPVEITATIGKLIIQA